MYVMFTCNSGKETGQLIRCFQRELPESSTYLMVLFWMRLWTSSGLPAPPHQTVTHTCDTQLAHSSCLTQSAQTSPPPRSVGHQPAGFGGKHADIHKSGWFSSTDKKTAVIIFLHNKSQANVYLRNLCSLITNNCCPIYCLLRSDVCVCVCGGGHLWL